jgi:hypothetical protein
MRYPGPSTKQPLYSKPSGSPVATGAALEVLVAAAVVVAVDEAVVEAVDEAVAEVVGSLPV